MTVPSGEWVAFYPGLANDDHYHLDFDRRADYEGPGINTQDSYECAVSGIGGAWYGTDTSYRAISGMFEGTRTSTGDEWLNVRFGDGRATSGGAATGKPRGPEDLVVAANFQVGNAASNLTIESEGGAYDVKHGRYWCLDGPSLWQGGTYKVSSTSFNVSDLTWNANVEQGLLVRVQTTLSEEVELSLTAPDGTSVVMPEGIDQTFCSEQTGPWTFALSSRLQAVGPWQLTISVLDAADLRFDCGGTWYAPEYFGQPAAGPSP